MLFLCTSMDTQQTFCFIYVMCRIMTIMTMVTIVRYRASDDQRGFACLTDVQSSPAEDAMCVVATLYLSLRT